MLTTALSPISVTVNNSVLNYTFGGSGYLTGATTLTKSGVGTLILANTGANAYTGATTVYAGVLQAGDGATAGAGQLGAGNIVLNGGILALDRPAGDDFSLGNTVSGTGNLTQEGGDVVTLTGNNMAFTGAFHVTNGTLRLGSVNGFGSAAGSVAGGGILDTTGYSIGNALSFNGGILQANSGAATLLSGPVTLSGNGLTVNVSSSATTTLTGTIKGTGPLLLNGGGTLVLSGGSNFVGNVAVNAGVLELGNSSGLGSSVNVVSVASSGTLDVAGYNIGNAIQLNAGTLRTSSGSNGQVGGGIALNGGGAVDVATGAALTLTNAISGSGGLTKTSGGTLVLSGGDTYAGGTSVAAGTLVFSSPATLPAGSSISVSTGVTVGFGFSLDQSTLASITPTSNAFTIALAANSSNNLNLVGYTSASLGSIGSASYSGVLTPGGANYNLGGGGGVLTVSSALSGSYGLSVGNTGNGIVLLTGNNSFTGGTTINGGILQIGSATALGSTTSVLTINAAGTLDLNGINTVLSGLSGTGAITDNSQTTGVTQLIVNIASGAIYTFTGTISEGSYPTRNVALVKSGAGTLVLNKANADSYYGGTFINGGVLQIRTNNNQVLPYETNITFAGNGTFQAYNNGTGSSTFTLGSLAFNAGLDVVDNYKGSTGAGNTLIFEGGFTRANGAVGNFTLSNGATAPGYITLAPSLPSNQFINGGIYYLGADFIASDSTNGIRALNYTSDQNVANAVLSASATSLAAVVGTSVTGTNLQLSGTGDITDQFSETLNSLKIGGNNNIVLDSSGSGAVLTLSSGGLLKTGGNAAVISGGAGITTASGGDLVIRVAAAADVLNITTSILSSSTGGLTVSGLGTLVLSGNNSYTGPTNVLQGTLQVGSATALGAANNGVIVAPAGTLDYAGMSSSQAILLNGGILTSSIGSGTISGAVTLQASSSVSASVGAQLVVATGISGSYGVTKTLPGTVVFTADNSYTGGTTISAGTLSLSGSVASGVVVQKGATLAQSGVVNGNVGLQSGAVYAPGGLSGTGQATVNGSLTINTGASVSFDIGGTNQGSGSGGYDFVTGVNQLNLSGKLSIYLVNGFMPTAGESFTLLDWSNLATPGSVTASGYQFDFSNALLAPGLSWDVSQFLTNGTILVDAVVVPEPGRVALLLVATLGMLGRRSRRRQ